MIIKCQTLGTVFKSAVVWALEYYLTGEDKSVIDRWAKDNQISSENIISLIKSNLLTKCVATINNVDEMIDNVYGVIEFNDNSIGNVKLKLIYIPECA